MFRDDVYLRSENELFLYDRRANRLYRIVNGKRSEVTDRDVVAMIVTSPAKVLSGNLFGNRDRQAADLAGV